MRGQRGAAVEAARTVAASERRPNRLAVAAFVAVFVPVAVGIAAAARRLLAGRG